jgi:hypothetical protein
LKNTQSFDEQNVVAVQDAQLDMVADGGVQLLKWLHRRVSQCNRRTGAAAQLPKTNPDLHSALVIAPQQPVPDQFVY